ncbi:MAG: MarR family transcriptional regulator [Methanospirillum sp.]
MWRSAYISLAVILVLLVVVPAAVNANGSSTSGAGSVAASSEGDHSATDAPAATPRAQGSASADGRAEARDPAAATASPVKTAATALITVPTTKPATVADSQQRGSTGNGNQTDRSGDSVPLPTASSFITSTAAGGMGVGSDGIGTVASGNTSSRGAQTPVTTAGTAPIRAGGDDTGKGGPVVGTGTAIPTAGAKAMSTATTAPVETSAALAANGYGTPGAAQTMSVAGLDKRGAAIDSPVAGGDGAGQAPFSSGGTSAANAGASFVGNSPVCDPGTGTEAAPTGTTAVRPTADGAGHGAATGTHAAVNSSGGPAHRTGLSVSRDAGSGSPAGRNGATPTVRPSSEGLQAFRAGAVAGAGGTTRSTGAGQGGTHGEPRPQNAGQQRGLPDPPAAAPVRTGLEPIDRSKDESGRGRRGLPTFPLPSETDDDVPDPLLLLRFLLFLGYRRIRPGNVLDHPLRRALHDALAADPGLDLAGCVVATGAHRETLRYHLALLVCSGKILEETRNGSVRYFPHDSALTPVHRAVLHLRRNSSLAPLLYHIRERPGVSRKDLAERLGVAGPSVNRQVQRLIDEGLVERRRCGQSQRYWLTPECAGAFASIATAEAAHDPVQAPDRASA